MSVFAAFRDKTTEHEAVNKTVAGDRYAPPASRRGASPQVRCGDRAVCNSLLKGRTCTRTTPRTLHRSSRAQ